MAPFNAWPVLFVTFPVAVWLIDGAAAGKRRGVPAAAMAGFWFGLGYFVPGLYWTGNAFLVDAPTFAWLMPFAVLGLPAYLALFPALGFALARLIWTRDASRVLALAIGLTVSEWLRGHVLSGFPVECLRLRAVGAAGAGADGVADRAVGHDLPQRGDLCQPGGADRRVFARPKALDRAGGGAVAAGRDGGLRRRAAVAAADRIDQGQAAHHAAEPAAGRQIQLRRQGGGDAEIPGACPTALRDRNPPACATCRS